MRYLGHRSRRVLGLAGIVLLVWLWLSLTTGNFN
mgnify:CR=1 FL=1